MRAVIQRVTQASVHVEDELVGEIGAGLVVLLGLHREDGEKQIPWLVNKISTLRIFSDEKGKMNLSVQEVKGDLLIISQFTLYGECSNGRRPEFTEAAPGEIAVGLYNRFITLAGQTGLKVATGRFGANMKLALVNDGPVTLIIESR